MAFSIPYHYRSADGDGDVCARLVGRFDAIESIVPTQEHLVRMRHAHGGPDQYFVLGNQIRE